MIVTPSSTTLRRFWYQIRNTSSKMLNGGHCGLSDYLRLENAALSWASWRFVLTINPLPCVAEGPGNYEKHSDKPFMGPRTAEEQEMKYNAQDAVTVERLIAEIDYADLLNKRRCGCCGLVEEISDAPLGYWSFAATAPGEDFRLCPSCAKQTAEFIAHLKDKNNPAAASADSGAWYHEDWD